MLECAAGIVTYNPEMERLMENIYAILPQVKKLIIVDNASRNVDELKAKFRDDNRIILIENKENKGIATALNQIMETSIQQGFQWTLTLDDDSVVPSDMIEQYQKYISKEQVAMIVPVIQDRTMEGFYENRIKEEEYEYIETAITSGTLMNNAVWREVNGFEDKLFIDYVDFDYCMRVKIAGYRVLRVNGVKLLHEIGNATEIKLFTILGNFFGRKTTIGSAFWKLRYTSNHSPMRLYYRTRNQYYYMKQYADYIDKKRFLRGMKIIWIVKLIFEKDRIKKSRAIHRGIMDGKKI